MTISKRALALVVVLVLAGGYPASAGENGVPAPDSVGLTFDDGPHPTWTPIVLDILDAHGVKATFFVVGRKVDMYPEIAREIVERGHSIQVHGYSHTLLTTMSNAQIEDSLRQSIASIYRATGVRPSCVRPPYGATNRRVEGVAGEVGLTVTRWTYHSMDDVLQTSSGVLSQTLGARPGHNVLAHDTWGSIWQHVLPKILQEFQSRGYGFDTVCENFGPYGAPRSAGDSLRISVM